jgi:S1-C subfamily serine protease
MRLQSYFKTLMTKLMQVESWQSAILICICSVGIAGCVQTTATAKREVHRGMSMSDVSEMLPDPDSRDFRGAYEAWQYADVVGFGQCEYITVFFAGDEVIQLTSRRGSSAGGCGLGSLPVDWSRVSSASVAPQPSPDTGGAGVSSQGTCFVVSPNGLLVTSHHVIDDAENISVIFSDGRELAATTEKTSAATDLAILRVNAATPDHLTLASARGAKIGDQIFTVGFPSKQILGSSAKFTEGSVSSLSGIEGESTYMQISVPVQPGSSGGPVANFEGRVIGVVAATAAIEHFYRETGSLPQNVNWAVKSDYVSLLMDSAQPVVPADANREDAIVRVQSAVCQVLAFR